MTSGLLFQLPVDKVPYADMYWILHPDTEQYKSLARNDSESDCCMNLVAKKNNVFVFLKKQKAREKTFFFIIKSSFFCSRGCICYEW